MTVENISIDVKTSAGSAAKQFRSLSSALSGVRNAGRSVASGGTQKAILGIGNHVKTATKHTSKLLSSIKRIAMYRLLRTALKEISQAFQEGLKNAYNFSKGIGGTLAATLDTVATKSMTMKNQLGAAFGSLLETIAPILLQIISLIQQAAAAISMLFAAFSGGQYLVAKDVATDWEKATGAAKKYKNTILGFDEINRLNDEQGGGGGASFDASKAFEVGEIPQPVQDFVDTIKSLIEHGNWKSLGMFVSAKINEVFDNWDAEGAGKTLGAKINNAINFAFGFLTRLNTTKVGEKVATFLNGAIGKINFSTLGATLTTAFTNAIDFLIGFITTFNTFQLGESIKNFIVGAFNKASEWLDTKDFKLLGNTVTYKIIGFFNGLDPAEVASSVGGFISKALTKASDFIKGINFEKVGKAIGDWFKMAFENVPWGEIAEGAWALLGESMGAVGAFSAGLIEGVLGREIEGFVQEMTLILSDAALVIGAILALTGANIPLGLGLMVAGVAGHEKATEDWNKLSTEIQNKLTLIEGLAAAASIAIGLILLLTGVSIPIGLGLLLAGVAVGASMKQPLWDAIPTQVGETLSHIGQVAGIAMIGLGIILLLTGVGIGFGLAMILAGVPILAASVAFDLNGTKNEINGAMESVGSTGQTQFGIIATAILAIVDAVKSVVDWFGRMKTSITEVNTRLNGLEQNHPDYGKFSYAVEGYATGFASGGFPDTGELFVAREAGPELVGTINGHTAVANNNQIVEGIASANEGVISAVYSMGNLLLKAVQNIDPDITLDGQSLADKMYHYNQQAANRYGAAMVT